MKNAWLIRPVPNGTNRINTFMDKKIIAIGWPGIGDLTGKSRQDLKVILTQPPYSYSGLKLGNSYATIDILVNQIKSDDLVLVPNGDDIYFGEVISGYQYDSTLDNDADGYPHQRSVRWLSHVLRKDLTKSLRNSLKVHRTAADLCKHNEEINMLAYGETYKENNDSLAHDIEITYPLRPDFTISLTIPNDLSKDEATRLSTYFSTLYFKE